MCKQKVVLETIKQMKGRGSMSAAQIKLAEAQCEDYQSLKKEVVDIKESVIGLKADNQEMRGMLKLLIEQNSERPLLSILKELSSKAWFWGWLIILTLLFFGASISELKDIIHIGG